MKGVRHIADATCLGCGCLCDDIELEVADNRIRKALRACPIGERWFLANRTSQGPACLVDGVPTTLVAACSRAAKTLTDARRPLVLGLGGLTCEAQRLAVELADRLGGRVDVGSGAGAALDDAMQSVGMVTATLGEVRHRADLVIFWGVDPATTHPRHFERYSLEPRGEFVPNGRADRTCVVIDSRRTATADTADVFLQIAPDADRAVIDILFALAHGSEELDPDIVDERTGVALAAWQELADRMKAARYGALFFGLGDKALAEPVAHVERMLTLVRDMNRRTRFVCLPLGAAGNDAGAKQVLAWQTGYSGVVDFSQGYPRHDDGGSRTDAVLVFACDPVVDSLDALPPGLPYVVVHTADVSPPEGTAVAIAVATAGIHGSGTVFRSDGVPLPLRGAITTTLPTAEAVLEAIGRRLGEVKSNKL